MSTTTNVLLRAIESSFPIVDGSWTITAQSVALTPEGDIAGTFAAQSTDGSGWEGVSVLVPARHASDPRALHWWRATLAGVRAVMRGETQHGFWLLSDVTFSEALDDATLQTPEDFTRVLSDKAQLERWSAARFRENVREEIAHWGLQDSVDEFLALARPAIQLAWPTRVEGPYDDDDADDDDAEERAESARDDSTPVGITRLGGEPDLLPETPWPMSGERPMTFAAQLNLEEIAHMPAASELPRTGLLSFFYDATPDIDFETSIELPSRVIHTPSLSGIARRATPPGGDRRPEYTVEPKSLNDTMPPYETPFYEALLPLETVTAFRRSLGEAAKGPAEVIDPLKGLPVYLHHWNAESDEESRSHRVLGYCRAFQGDPYLDTEVSSRGRGWKGWEEGSLESIEIARAARRWRSLLQLCADGDGELLFNQDSGYLYFMIPDDALARHDWNRVYCILQCG